MNDQNATEESLTARQPDPEPEKFQPHQFRLDWRVIVGFIIVVVVGYLVTPPLNLGGNEADSQNSPAATVEADTQFNAPVATAQANPQSAEAQFNLGNAYYEAGEFDQAVQAFLKAIELNPNYQAAYANLGVTYYQQQQFELAATQYEKALELNPEDGEVAYNLGALYLQQALLQNSTPNLSLLDQAILQLQQAQQISPDLAEPYFSLGVAFLAKNQPQEARAAFEQFLSFENLDSRAKQEAERYLQTLAQ